MAVTLRSWQPVDLPFLWDMLYASIHVRDGATSPPRSILRSPRIAHHLNDFGTHEGDDAVIAADDGVPIGAAFCRRFTIDDQSYGFVSANVPEVGMAVIAGRRGVGVGRVMLTCLLDRHPTMSLSVDADNAGARRLYDSLGFTEVHRDGTAITMVRRPRIGS